VYCQTPAASVAQQFFQGVWNRAGVGVVSVDLYYGLIEVAVDPQDICVVQLMCNAMNHVVHGEHHFYSQVKPRAFIGVPAGLLAG